MLPDPVQYAVSENRTAEQPSAEVELKAVQNEYPPAEEFPDFSAMGEETASSAADPQAEEENPQETKDNDPADGLQQQENGVPDPEADEPQLSPTPVPEPVTTASSKDVPDPTQTPKQKQTPSLTPKPTRTPKQTPSPTPKPTRTPKPTPDQDSGSVPVTVREETPAPEVELNPVATPTTTPAAPSPTAEPVTVSEHELAARVAFFESGSEEGRMAVLSVIYNRCNSSAFGGGKTDIRTEVYRKNQFSVVKRDDFLTASVPSSLVDAAKRVFTQGGSVLPENVVFFRVASKGTEWGDKIYYDTIGGNCFFASAE
ncbi:MAG: cell wall hydrolase [Clostridiales bacterium]|nr:cell wall hydrolase [Clostridiales bacterium]